MGDLKILETILKKKTISLNDYKLIRSFNDEVLFSYLKQSKELENIIFKKTDIVEILYDFLKELGYEKAFEQVMLNNELVLVDKEDEKLKKLNNIGIYASIYLNYNNIQAIIIPKQNNIRDIFNVAHEITHHCNLLSSQKYNSNRLSETLSIASEFLLEEYLVKNDIYESEAKKAMLDALNTIHLISKFIDLDFTFILNYKTAKNLNEIIEDEEINEDLLNLYLENVEYYKNFTFLNLQNYIYGIIYASYITNGDDKIELFKSLNKKIAEISFSKFNKKLDIDLNNSKSFQKVYRAYRKKAIESSVDVWTN